LHWGQPCPTMPAAQRSSCYSTVVPDYVRLCRGMLAACVPTEQPDDPCACDLDGVVPAQNASGAALLIATGRPGCAAHTSVWGHQSSPLCYVSQRCTAPGVSDVHDWPYIRWRPCTPSRGQACPARCQRALDALLAVGPVRSCITGPAQRQVGEGGGFAGACSNERDVCALMRCCRVRLSTTAQALCPVLDMLSGLGASAAADSSPSAPLDGQHFTSMRYLRLWGATLLGSCRVCRTLDLNLRCAQRKQMGAAWTANS
jgi:hypothetical protein